MIVNPRIGKTYRLKVPRYAWSKAPYWNDTLAK